jgi:hypothetical protein
MISRKHLINILGYACNLTSAFFILLFFVLMYFMPVVPLREPNMAILIGETMMFAFGLMFAVYKIGVYFKTLAKEGNKSHL